MNVAYKKSVRNILLEAGYKKTHVNQLMRVLLMEIKERGFKVEKRMEIQGLRDVKTGEKINQKEQFNPKEKKKKRGRPRKVV